MKSIVVVGAGGFAREVAWLLAEINRVRREFEFLGFVVSDLNGLGDHDSRDKVLGDFEWLSENRKRVDALALGIGTPGPKARVVQELSFRHPEAAWPVLIHPSVTMDRESAVMEQGVVICAGVLATVNVRLRAYCMVNLGCTLGHEADIGDYSVLNPTVNVSGGVQIGKGVLVGTGAQVLQYVHVGDDATVGAGAVVTRSVDAGLTVVGVPAKSR